MIGAVHVLAVPSRRPNPSPREVPSREGGVSTNGGRRSDQWGELGVHLPFLAPTLSGVRLRTTGSGLEFVLPNPSGGRGVYVASWNVVTGFAAPMPHDTLLVERLAGLGRIGPAEVRDAARRVALEGFAGPAAADAAREAQRATEDAVARLRVQFVCSIARIAGFASDMSPIRLIERARFGELARRLGWQALDLALALEALSLRCASVMVGRNAGMAASMAASGAGGRWNRMRALLRRLKHSMSATLYGRNDVDAMLLGRVVMAAERCLRACDELLPRIETLLADPLAELELCRSGNVEATVAWLDEVELVLDGWDRIGLLWFDVADERTRRELIPEIAALARTGGGDGWSGAANKPGPAGWDANGGSEDVRRGRLRERNERVRTMELAFEARGGCGLDGSALRDAFPAA